MLGLKDRYAAEQRNGFGSVVDCFHLHTWTGPREKCYHFGFNGRQQKQGTQSVVVHSGEYQYCFVLCII